MRTDRATKAIADLAAEAAKKRAKAAEKAKRRRRVHQTTAPTAVAARVYHAPDIMRICYLAGEGMSGGEIAVAVGGTTRARIASLLSKVGLSTVHRTSAEKVARVVVNAKLFARIEAAAFALDIEPTVLAGRLLDTLGAEPVILKNLVEEMG